MSVPGGLAGALVGTVVLTTALRAASEARLTRIDLPFLLGTAFTRDRMRAKLLGYAAHFAFGFLFALGYLAVFAAVGRSGWLLGSLLGVAHGAFAATAIVNVLLPILHPRMGTPFTAAGSAPLLEPPGFLMRNYGRATPVVTLAAHAAYGALVGGFAAMGA